MTKKEKPEIKTIEDVQQLPAEDQTKWEIANELGYFDKIVATGWKSLTSRESGRIGGMLSSRTKKKRSESLICPLPTVLCSKEKAYGIQTFLSIVVPAILTGCCQYSHDFPA